VSLENRKQSVTRPAFVGQLARCELDLKNARTAALATHLQYETAVEETGRLEARLKAFTYSAETEQAQLATEVRKRDDLVQSLRTQLATTQDIVASQRQQVPSFPFCYC